MCSLFRAVPAVVVMLGMGFHAGVHIICSRLLPGAVGLGCCGDAGAGLWLYCSLQVATPYLGNTLGLDHPRCIWWWSTCAVYLPYRFLSHTTLTILAWGSWQWWYFCIECSFGLFSSAAFPIGSKSSLSWFLLIQTLLASSAIGQEFHPTDCC
jgi:hypothetical protein